VRQTPCFVLIIGGQLPTLLGPHLKALAKRFLIEWILSSTIGVGKFCFFEMPPLFFLLFPP
jgi:hypothetical protein